MVECFLAKEDVAGSTPVSRSKRPLLQQLRLALAAWAFVAQELASGLWRGTQVVRERSAKPLCAGSIPARASISPRLR